MVQVFSEWNFPLEYSLKLISRNQSGSQKLKKHQLAAFLYTYGLNLSNEVVK